MTTQKRALEVLKSGGCIINRMLIGSDRKHTKDGLLTVRQINNLVDNKNCVRKTHYDQTVTITKPLTKSVKPRVKVAA